MIESRELRQGNIVLCDYDWCEVLEIMQEQLRCRKIHPIPGQDDIYIIHTNNVHGVILTPELLDKCGFEKDGFGAYGIDISGLTCNKYNRLYFVSDYLYLRQGENEKRSEDDIVTLWNKDIMKVFYLHSLQNLFWFLTSQELKVTI